MNIPKSMRYNPSLQLNVADLDKATEQQPKPQAAKQPTKYFNDAGEVLFRASGVGDLMVNPRTKKAREAGELSETAKTFINELWLESKFGFKEPLNTYEVQKGHMCEDDSIKLLQVCYPTTEGREKNEQRFSDQYFRGTPDIILDDYIEDVKTCFTGLTFAKKKEVPKLYYAQGQVYMHLTGRKKFRLVYTFVDTPEIIMTDLERNLYFKHNCNEESPAYIEDCENLRRLHSTQGIPAKNRLKIFEFDYSEEYMNDLTSRVEKAREYFSKQQLGGYIKL